MARDGSILQRIRSLLTEPRGENNEYVRMRESFNNFIIFTFVASSYCIYYFLPGLERVALWLPRILPFTEARLETFLRYGLESYLAYAASMLSLLVLTPLTIGLYYLVAWKTIVAMVTTRDYAALMRKLNENSEKVYKGPAILKNPSPWDGVKVAVILIVGLLSLLAIFYMFHVLPFPEDWTPGRRGWAVLWPFSPLFFGMTGFLIPYTIHVIIILFGRLVNAAARAVGSILRRADRGG
jgi:hypothetical protein